MTRAKITSIAKACPDCGALNRLVVFTTEIEARWPIHCSRCGATIQRSRGARQTVDAPPAAGLPVPRGPAPRSTLPARRPGRELVEVRRVRPVVPLPGMVTHASVGAACAAVIALVIAFPHGPESVSAPFVAAIAAAPEQAEPGKIADSAPSPRLPADPSIASDPPRLQDVAAHLRGDDLPETYPDAGQLIHIRAIPQMLNSESAAAAESWLELDRRTRRAVQRRLQLANHDPKAVDGIFGPATREAIGAWQESAGIPVTGYLDSVALARLEAQTEAEYRHWRAAAQERQQRHESELAALSSPLPPSQPGRGDQCDRLFTGQITYGRNFRCDVRGLQEDLRGLKQNLVHIIRSSRGA